VAILLAWNVVVPVVTAIQTPYLFSEVGGPVAVTLWLAWFVGNVVILAAAFIWRAIALSPHGSCGDRLDSEVTPSRRTGIPELFTGT
jgi:hypothetical protein